ncbi:MAG: GGDEF domain-containing protein [Christensenellales bacterium]
MRKWFLRWAFLDIEGTDDRRQTYFGRCAREIGIKNLRTIRSLSACFVVVSASVILSCLTFFPWRRLLALYTGALALEGTLFLLSSALLRTGRGARGYNAFAAAYLLHVLAFGAYVGTIMSVDESAPVFLVVLVVSQMLFILPPVLTTSLAALATAATLIISFHIKSSRFFLADAINCVGVFILSILLGWMVNKTRAEEAFARERVLQLNDELQQRSVTDQLTGLPNHRSFQDTYYALYEACEKTGAAIGVIMMDIDKFKLYNDHYGHLMGDDCLAKVGAALRRLQRENVTVYRFGGEEFLALLKASACGRAGEIAEQMRRAVEQLAIPHALGVSGGVVTLSVGWHVGAPSDQEPPTHFLDQADRAMYQSKADGGNRVSRF